VVYDAEYVVFTVPTRENIAVPAGGVVPPVSLNVELSVTDAPYITALGEAVAVSVPVPIATATETTAGSVLVLVA
jgi:hypothetical protein